MHNMMRAVHPPCQQPRRLRRVRIDRQDPRLVVMVRAYAHARRNRMHMHGTVGAAREQPRVVRARADRNHIGGVRCGVCAAGGVGDTPIPSLQQRRVVLSLLSVTTTRTTPRSKAVRKETWVPMSSALVWVRMYESARVRMHACVLHMSVCMR
jgi:hypothetical protein